MGVEVPEVVVESPADGKLNPKENRPQNKGHGSGQGLTTEQAKELHIKYGYNEVKAKKTPEWRKIVRRYFDWIPLIILVGAIVSIAVPDEGGRGYLSFGLLMFELNLVVWVGWYTDYNAGNAIKELESLAAPTALCLRDNQWTEIAVRELVPDDIVSGINERFIQRLQVYEHMISILLCMSFEGNISIEELTHFVEFLSPQIALKGGDIVPADCQLLGASQPLKLDESSLTGESLSVKKGSGEIALSGSIVEYGAMNAKVVAIGSKTFFGKTLLLLGTQEKDTHLQKVLRRASVLLGIIGMLGASAIFGVLTGRGDHGVEFALVTAFVVLISTVPIAMPVVVGAVLAVGARRMAGEQAIVSRLSALEELSGMEVLCTDKTGTLTVNILTLDRADIAAWGNYGVEDVLLLASLSVNWENQDAIDRAIASAIRQTAQTTGWKITQVVPFNPVDKKTEATAITPEGHRITASKGAPQIIRNMLDDPDARAFVDSYIQDRASRGLRSLGVAVSINGEKDFKLAGLLSFLDPPRKDSADTIKMCQENLGIKIKMITGDQLAIAMETCRRLGMGTDILDAQELTKHELSENVIQKVEDVDGFAGVYPEHKFNIIEAFQARGTLVGMTGDGVNDAPALKKANVGIAVAGATSAAKGAADILLTQEGISTIAIAIKQSRKIFRRLESYIAYRLSSSLIILFFFLLSIIIFNFTFPTWTLVIISLTNDLSVMATSFDKVNSSDLPKTWNMTKELLVASALATVSTGMLILLLLLADPTRLNFWGWWNQSLSVDTGSNEGTTSAQTNAIMYLGLTLFIQLQILLTRNTSFWWNFGPHTAPRPSWLLLCPVFLFTLGATFIAVYWPISAQPGGGIAAIDGAGWVPCLVVWLYALIWLNVADFAKYLMQKLYRHYDVVVESCKRKGEPLPKWIRLMDLPGEIAENVASRVESKMNEISTRIMNTLSSLVRVGDIRNCIEVKTH